MEDENGIGFDGVALVVGYITLGVFAFKLIRNLSKEYLQMFKEYLLENHGDDGIKGLLKFTGFWIIALPVSYIIGYGYTILLPYCVNLISDTYHFIPLWNGLLGFVLSFVVVVAVSCFMLIIYFKIIKRK